MNARGWSNVVFDLWNEPDNAGFWPSQDRSRLFATCVAEAKSIRAACPGASLVGPSTSRFDSDYLTAFVTALDAEGVAPEVLSWHEMSPDAPATIGDHVATARQIYAQITGKPNVEVHINEMSPPDDTWSTPGQINHYSTAPGLALWFFAALDRAGVAHAARA